MKKILALLILFILIGFISFNFKNKKEEFTASYYLWENTYKEKIEDEKLYIKVLDIKYTNQLEFIKTNFITKAPKDFVPVIFITNKTMQKISYKELSSIVISSLKSFDFNFDEIQIDCDWTNSTKDNFFAFLEELKTSLQVKLSATIRLHQIKYFPKTGVPNLDYGVLMYYNMAELLDFETKNYILDNEIAKKYHYNFDKYPLKLKLALPLYSQAVQFRDEKAISLFEGVSKEELKNNFEELKNNRYLVKKSHYFKGKYIYKDDILRLEEVKEEELIKAFKAFKELSKNYFNEVIFYTYKYKRRYNTAKILKD